MNRWWIPLFALVLLPSRMFASDRPWVYVIVNSRETGWSVSQQGRAEVSVSGKELVVNLHDPTNPSVISGTIRGKIDGTNIFDALETSHLPRDGDSTEYRVVYSGSINRIEYQASVGGPAPGGRETIMLKSKVAFIGLTREFDAK